MQIFPAVLPILHSRRVAKQHLLRNVSIMQIPRMTP
jgi:hypothetical protein